MGTKEDSIKNTLICIMIVNSNFEEVPIKTNICTYLFENFVYKKY